MKRILSLFIALVLILSTFASCDWFKKDDPTTTEADIKEAVKQLNDMYEDLNGTSIPNDYELVAQVKVGKTVFKVTWTTDNEKVTVTENDGLAYVNISKDITEDEDYTLTGTVTSDGGQKAEVSYNLKLLVASTFGMITNPVIGETYKLALLHGNFAGAQTVVYFDGDIYNESNPWYLHVSTDISTAVDVTLEAVDGVEGAFRLSFEIDGVKKYLRPCTRDTDVTKGNVFIVDAAPEEYFTFSTEYNTLIYTHEASGNKFFLGSSGTNKSISCSNISYIDGATNYPARLYGEGGVQETLKDQVLPTIPDNYTSRDVVEALYKLEPGQTIEDSYEITGVVTSIKYAYDPSNNNISVNIVVDGMTDKPVLCYRITGASGVDTIKVGDTITVFAGLTNYNGTFETVQGGVLRNVVPGTDVPTPPVGGGDTDNLVPVVVTNPEVGVAYKFGMYQGNKGANYYLKGGMSNYYMATTNADDYDSALDFYIEETEGGYYMYCMEGTTKKYVNFVVSGTYVNGAYETTPSTVFTFNSNGIFSTIVNGEEYGFGTYDNYVTLGPNKTSYTTNFFGYFYTLGESEDDNGGNQGGTTTPTYTAPEVGKAYKFYLEQKSQNKNFFFNGGSESYGGGYIFLTSESSDDAVEIFFETNGNGYNIYFYNPDNVKTYFDVAPYSGGTPFKCQFKLSTEIPSTVWTYDTTYGVIKASVTFEGNTAEFYAGNYDSGTTIRLSNYSFVGQLLDTTKNQYAARIELADGTVTPPATCEHNYVDGTCTKCGAADPNYQPSGSDVITTIPGALAAGEGAKVELSGTVVEIYQPYSSQYNNISVYIADDEGNRILVFRVTGNFGVGDKLSIKGLITMYNSTAQVAQGATVVSSEKHVCSEFTEATCLNKAACVVCGATTGELAAHNYVEGTCTTCGAEEGVSTITASKTMAELITALGWTDSTTKQSFNLDDNVTVKINGGNNTGKAYNGDHIRIYATDSPAGTITITVPEGYELVSVKVTAQTGTYAFLYVDGSSTDISNVKTAVSGTSVLLNSVKNGSDGKQVRVMAIEVEYKAK